MWGGVGQWVCRWVWRWLWILWLLCPTRVTDLLAPKLPPRPARDFTIWATITLLTEKFTRSNFSQNLFLVKFKSIGQEPSWDMLSSEHCSVSRSKICFWIIAEKLFWGFWDLTKISEKVFDRERELLLHRVAPNSPGAPPRATLGMVNSKSN